MVPKLICHRDQKNLLIFFPRESSGESGENEFISECFQFEIPLGIPGEMYSSRSWKSGFGCDVCVGV